MKMIAVFYPWMVFLIFFGAFLHRLDSVHGGDSVRGGNTSFASSFTRIPRDLYHSSGSLLKEINALVDRHPEKLAMEFIRASNKGYGADVPVVTYNHAKQKEKNDSRYRILLSFGQHGRELITTEVALHLLSILSEEDSPLGIFGFDPTALEKNLENLVIKVVPMENLKGRELVEAGEFCERRNGRGVDLNRNWSVDWGKKEKDYDPYEENPGAAPFSEPEAQIMRMLSNSFNPHIWVNVHSGMEALFMPYDHKNTTPDGFTSQLMKSMLKGLNHHHFQDRCLVGSGGGSVGYLAHGTTTDYMYEIAKVPLSFTFEIYGDSSASSKDCFKMFNPVDAATFQRVIKEWCGAFLSIFKAGPELLKSANMTQGGRWISIGAGSLEGLSDGNSREKGRNMDGLEFGMSEMRTYFRLFMLSCCLLMFMFCSRISKAKFRQGCQYML